MSIDELVQPLVVHRNSLYKTFGSKRGLYRVALRWNLKHRLPPLADQLAADADVVDNRALDLLLLAAVERAPADVDVAALVATAWQARSSSAAGAGRPSPVARGPLC